MATIEQTSVAAQPRPLAEVVREIEAAVSGVRSGWTEAEVLKANHWNGLVFLELSGGENIKAEAMIFQRDVRRCEDGIGGPFAAGQQVAVRVDRAQFSRGRLRLIVSAARPVGEGELLRRRTELLRRLEGEGLVGRVRRQLPTFAQTIGLVCGDASEALDDVVGGIRARWPATTILLSPATVQGAAAPDSISRAIAALHLDGRSDLIVLARGGGSVTDLQSFDSEEVARIVAHSSIPVLAAIGHTKNRPVSHMVAEWTANVPREVGLTLYQKGTDEIAEELERARGLLSGRGRLREVDKGVAEAAARLAAMSGHSLAGAERALAQHREELRVVAATRLSGEDVDALGTELAEVAAAARERLSLAAEREQLRAAIRDAVRRAARAQEEVAEAPVQLARVVRGRVRSTSKRLEEMTGERIRCHRRRLDAATARHSELVGDAVTSAKAAIRRHQKQLAERQGESDSMATAALFRAQRRLDDAGALLRARDPVARGFAVVRMNGRPVKGAGDVKAEDRVAIELRDGVVGASVTGVEAHD